MPAQPRGSRELVLPMCLKFDEISLTKALKWVILGAKLKIRHVSWRNKGNAHAKIEFIARCFSTCPDF